MNKRLLTCVMLASFLSMPMSVFAAVDVNTVPDLNSSVNGIVTNTGNGLNAQVGDYDKGSGAVGQFDWNHFNLGSNKTVNWAFTNTGQTALNRVLGNNMSEIYGKLTQSCAVGNCGNYTESGKVILINPNGMLFGAGSSVKLNSFTASTFDADKAKNIQNLNAADLAAYKNSLNSNFGNGININFSGTASKIGSMIKLQGTDFDIDKTLVLMAKDVEIKDGSVVTTNIQYNYDDSKTGAPQSFSNIKIYAGNGAQLKYQANGYVNNGDAVANAGLAGVDYNITVEGTGTANSRVAGFQTGGNNVIQSGNILIKNSGLTDNSNITIKKADISGMKLLNHAYGNVAIEGNSNVSLTDSNITTYNTRETNTPSKNTHSQKGGNVTITAGKNVTLDNTKVVTAYSAAAIDGGSTSVVGPGGDITITSKTGNVDVKNNSRLDAKGNVLVDAAAKANIANSIVIARNLTSHQLTGATINIPKNVTIKGGSEVNIASSSVDASNDVTINSAKIDIQKSTINADRDNKIAASATTLGVNESNLIAGRNNELEAKGGIVIGATTLNAAKNNVTSKDSSISLYNVTIAAKNAAKPEDTITTLTAKTDIKTLPNGVLATNGTKLIADAGKVNGANGNFTNTGDVNLNLTGANNVKAGVEITGKNVTLNGVDNVLSISRIVADKLNLDANDRFIAANTVLTTKDKEGLDDPATEAFTVNGNSDSAIANNSRAYIEIRTPGGFNLDTTGYSIDESGAYQNFSNYADGKYTASYQKKAVGNEDGYAKHFVNMSGDQKFLLVYDKPVEACATNPDVPPDLSETPTYDDQNLVRLPLQSVFQGKGEPITNNLADTTSSIVAAAAGISLVDENTEENEWEELSYQP